MLNLKNGFNDYNESLQSFVNKYGSEDEMIEVCSKDISTLVALFESIGTEKRTSLNDMKLFDKILNKIKNIDVEGGVDESQINRIISISMNVYPNITDSLLRSSIIDFRLNHINASNVYVNLKLAKQENDVELVAKCLEYIQKETGVSIALLDDHAIHLECKNPNVNFLELSKQIGELSSIFKQISLDVAPDENVKKSDIRDFFKKHGGLIHTLDLTLIANSESETDSEIISSRHLLDDAIKFCPNLHQLSIGSECAGDSLPDLSGLMRLTVLRFFKCMDLEKLPALPASLKELDLSWCVNLEKLSAMPKGLEVLNLSWCRNLDELLSLPSNLKTLVLDNCESLEELPDLPEGLKVLNLCRCLRLEELPDLPVSLELLDISHCDGFYSLPTLPPTLKTLQIAGCSSLEELPDLPPNLTELDLTGCSSLEKLPNLPSGLTKLILTDCTSLKQLPDLPAGLQKLVLSNCQDLSQLPVLPSELKVLVLNNCNNLMQLSELPADLIELDISNCSQLEQLPSLPKGMLSFKLSGCTDLKALSDLPGGLKVFNLSGCRSLKELPSLPLGLIELDLTNCENLVMIPELPEGLIKLNLSGCERLLRLSPFPESLQQIELPWTEDHLSLALSTLFAENIDHGINFLKRFYIKDKEKLFKLIAEKVSEKPKLEEQDYKIIFAEFLQSKLSDQTTPHPTLISLAQFIIEYGDNLSLHNEHPLMQQTIEIISLLFIEDIDQGINFLKRFHIKDKGNLFKLIAEKVSEKPDLEEQDYKVIFAEFLQSKLSDQTTPHTTLIPLAQFILEYRDNLSLHDEHPLMQQAIEIISLSSVGGDKNPFSLFRKLKELSEKKSDFIPPSIEVNGIPLAINMNQLSILSRGSKIRREDLPKNVTREGFDQFVNSLKNKVDNNKEVATDVLRDMDTTWETISVPIFNDPTNHLAGLLSLEGANVSDPEAQWRAVLSNIFAKDPTPVDNKFFSEREEVFILTMMGIQNCEGGKNMGIALSYQQLDPSFHYKIGLPKVLSQLQSETEVKEDKAKNFIKNFIEEQSNPNNELIASDLIRVVNENLKENSQLVYPLISDEKYWVMDEDTYDMLLNEEGAIKLLTLVKIEIEAEKNKQSANQFIAQIVKNYMASQFTGTNPLMKELAEVDNIEQGAHLAIYMNNLIGSLVGINQGSVVFDRHSGVLYDSLVSKDRDEVLATFFKFVTPETLINEIVRAVNEKPEENKLLLTPIVGEEFWDQDEAGLSSRGALVLLEKLGYLERRV